MRIPKFLFIAMSLIVVSPALLAQYITVPANDVIRFEDNGEIRSSDHAHRIMFRRSDNTLEFREFGRIVFSPGSTSGTETAKMVILDNGNVGIGTASPGAPLSVLTTNTNTYANISSFRNTAASNSWILVANNNGQANLGMGGARPHAYLWSSTDKFFIGDEVTPTMFIDGMTNGNVSIGTTDSKGYKLAVNGNAVFNKVVVKQTINWPDYVFHTNYRLRPLSEVEQYIKQYGHLPEVPNADEVQTNGLDVGDNQATLLKKIEELTMYVIEQNKKIEALEVEMKSIKRKGK